MKKWIKKLLRNEPGEFSQELDLLSESPLFDLHWYISNNIDVNTNNHDATLHYLLHGGSEGRNPSPYFNTQWYLSSYPDVAEAGINPLVHFLRSGHAENRLPLPPQDLLKIARREVFRGLAIDFDAVEASERQTDHGLIRDSGFFDEKWYLKTYPDIAEAAIDPLEHFISSGGLEGRSPGPLFNTEWYNDAYPDAVQSGINPLVHFLRIGQAAGLEPLPPAKKNASISTRWPSKPGTSQPKLIQPLEDDIKLIEQSSLFNAKWYLATYPTIAKSGVDPVHHYARFGAFQKRNPSIYFDSEYYLQQVPELRDMGVNPLVHYLREGQAAGLKTMALFDFDNDPTSLSWGMGVRYVSSSDWLPADNAASLVLGAHRLGWTSFEGRGRRNANQALVPFSDAVHAFLALSGTAAGSTGFRSVAKGQHKPAPSPSSRVRSVKTLAFTGSARLSITDAWLPSDFDLRLRLEIAPGPHPQGDALDVQISFFQYDPDSRNVCRVGGSPLLKEGPFFATAALRDPYLPVLAVVTEQDGNLTDISLLPFPALCRGGCYYGELGFNGFAPNAFERLKSYSNQILKDWFDDDKTRPLRLKSVRVDSRHALGAERIFQPSYLAWIVRVMGLKPTLKLKDPAVRSDVIAYLGSVLDSYELAPDVESLRPETGITLNIPPYALPSMRALVSRTLDVAAQAQGTAGSFVICDETSGEPQTAVVLPQVQNDLQNVLSHATTGFYPYFSKEHSNVESSPSLVSPAALLFRPPTVTNNVTALTSQMLDDTPLFGQRLTPEDCAKIQLKVVASFHSGLDLALFARSLKEQTLGHCITDLQFVYTGAEKNKTSLLKGLDILFPGRKRTVAASLDKTEGVESYILFCNAAVLLPDRRTLECLVHMNRLDGVASAGCVTMYETTYERKIGRNLRKVEATNFSSGGYFPTHLGLDGPPAIAFKQADSLKSLPDMTYPVVANSLRMTLFREDVLSQLAQTESIDPSEVGKDLELGLLAIQAGYRNLCTSVVKGLTQDEFRAPELADTISNDFIPYNSWPDVLASCTILRAIA